MDTATKRVEAFGAMEFARRDGEFEAAAAAKDRLERLGIRVRYTRTRWRKPDARRGGGKEAHR